MLLDLIVGRSDYFKSAHQIRYVHVCDTGEVQIAILNLGIQVTTSW